MSATNRLSNIELFRIFVMLAIVAHHFVVNSGLRSEILANEPFSGQSMFYYLFGMWGKTGINCFVLITGYFMCTSEITMRKFLKLYLQVLLYRLVIWGIFIACGRDAFSFGQAVRYILPFAELDKSFVQCFIAFFLFIPFLNILLRNISKHQHLALISLLLLVHTGMMLIPGGKVVYNYVSWFVTLYFIASYIRLYGLFRNNSVRFWGLATLVGMLVSMLSVVVLMYLGGKHPYLYVSDSPAILAVVTSISTFMFFKNLPIKYTPIINIIASGTFGVLLIHAHSNAMRWWLWRDVVDVMGHYGSEYQYLYTIGVVIAVFTVCCFIDLGRKYLLEKPLFDKCIIRKSRHIQRD